MTKTTIELTEASYAQLAQIKPAKLSLEAFLAKLIAKEYASTGKPSTGSANFDKYGSAYVTSPELAKSLAELNFEGKGNISELLAEPGCLDAIRFLTSRFSYENWQSLLSQLPQSARLALEPTPTLDSFAVAQYAMSQAHGVRQALSADLLNESAEQIHKTVASQLERALLGGKTPAHSAVEARLEELAQFAQDTESKLAILLAKQGA